jgi:uncharacterized protein (DUF4415 family)/uncharacterized DUF497 family protein
LTEVIHVFTFIALRVTFDPAKRLWTLSERGIDFAIDAEKVFAGETIGFTDNRFDYGETREITIGWLDGRMVVMVWTKRGTAHHVISMRFVMPRKGLSTSLSSKASAAPGDAGVDPDDAPELTDELLEHFADTMILRHGDKVIARGRPALDAFLKKTTITIRLDPDVVESYRAIGSGWQTRVNADLRKARKLGPKRKTA